MLAPGGRPQGRALLLLGDAAAGARVLRAARCRRRPAHVHAGPTLEREGRDTEVLVLPTPMPPSALPAPYEEETHSIKHSVTPTPHTSR